MIDTSEHSKAMAAAVLMGCLPIGHIPSSTRELASDLGCDDATIIVSRKLSWNISPGDDSLYAEVEIGEHNLNASIWLNYLNKPAKVIGITKEGDRISVSGVLKRSGDPCSDESILDAIRTFKSHLRSMSSGPYFSYSEVDSAVMGGDYKFSGKFED